MSRKHKKFCTTLNYTERFLILASAIPWQFSISGFASWLGIHIGITSSGIRFKIYATVAGIKKYKSISKKKKKKHNKIVFLRKSKLNSIEVLISRVLIDSIINHDEFVLINNVLKECDDMKDYRRF